MSQGYQVDTVDYNDVFKVIGVHPVDGRIFATKNHNGVDGLFVVDRDLTLVSTLNTTIPFYMNECKILSSGTMLIWGIYRSDPNATVIYRSNDTSYSSFTAILTLPIDVNLIERSLDVSTVDDTIMFAEYTLSGAADGLWLAPLQVNIWRGSNDGQTWEIVQTVNRNAQFIGDTDRIRHFHTVRYDPYENLFWVGAGDNTVECKIWTLTPDGNTFTLIGEGNAVTSQEWRTTNIMFTKNYVYWGADSYSGVDHCFQRWSRATETAEDLILPNDCVRSGGKFRTLNGDLMVAIKGFESGPDNTGETSELYLCDDFEAGDWYSVYSWNKKTGVTLSYFPQVVSDGTNRLFLHGQNIKDGDGTDKTNTTIILDLKEVDSVGYTKLAREVYEEVTYRPPLKNTTNLEAATKTITATAEASGVGNADYSSALTFTVPTDARIVISRLCARLSVTVDSMTATHLYCKVYVDVQDADHLLFSEDITATGAKLDAVDLTASSKATIFNIIKAGTAHTLYFFFYVDAGNAVLSAVQAWEGWGTCSATYVAIGTLNHSGIATVYGYITKEGTGTPGLALSDSDNTNYGIVSCNGVRLPVVMDTALLIAAKGTVVTDCNYCYSFSLGLRTLL